MNKTKTKLIKLTITLLIVISCFAFSAKASEKQLLMATTTSTDNTGLLDYLAPKFEASSGIELKWVSTGTGKALKLGENCDADVLLVHAPAAEKEYLQAGFGINRREIMYNDFVLIGPAADPAGIKGKSVAEALQTIQTNGAKFVSRGDNSGTHKKELSLWKSISLQPEKEAWYVQTGQGMLATITVASEQNGYTMTDRGTYIKYEANHNGNPTLHILVEGDALLLNQYSVLEVNPERCPQVKNDLAKQWSDWLASDEGQEAIGAFRLMDKQLFTSNAKK